MDGLFFFKGKRQRRMPLFCVSVEVLVIVLNVKKVTGGDALHLLTCFICCCLLTVLRGDVVDVLICWIMHVSDGLV